MHTSLRAPCSPQSSCHYAPAWNESSPYGRLLSQGRMALIKACEEPRVTGDKFYWELTCKNEGAMQSQLLPDGIDGLNCDKVAKMDGEWRTFLLAVPRLYVGELSWQPASPAYLLTAFIHGLTDWEHLNTPEFLSISMPSLKCPPFITSISS